AIGQANALLTYEIGMLCNGDRLDTLKPRLDEIQKRLSKVNAMLIMDPDRKITFDTMSDADVAERMRQDEELERLTSLPTSETQVLITADPRDDRRIANEVADAV